MNDSVSIFKAFVSILAIPFTIFISSVMPQKPQIYPGSMENYSSVPQEISTPVKNNLTNSISITPTPTQNKVKSPCGPGKYSGQTIYLDNANDCQNYTDCGLSDGSWSFMTKSDCNVAQGKTNSGSGAGSKIDCVGPDGKHLQITQKECDDFNSAWKKPQSVICQIVPGQSISVGSQVECERAKATFPGTNSRNNIQTSTSSTNYPPCTVNYNFGGPYTYYYMTPEQCSAEQAKAASLKTSNKPSSAVENFKAETQQIIDAANNYKIDTKSILLEQERQNQNSLNQFKENTKNLGQPIITPQPTPCYYLQGHYPIYPNDAGFCP